MPLKVVFVKLFFPHISNECHLCVYWLIPKHWHFEDCGHLNNASKLNDGGGKNKSVHLCWSIWCDNLAYSMSICKKSNFSNTSKRMCVCVCICVHVNGSNYLQLVQRRPLVILVVVIATGTNDSRRVPHTHTYKGRFHRFALSSVKILVQQ